MVTGRGAELGTPLIEHSDFIMFTGSTATGRRVAAQCGEQLISCAMELGGKNALLALPDAPLWRAVPGAVQGITSNSGQLCISIERLYVHDAIYDAFVPRLAERLAGLRARLEPHLRRRHGVARQRRPARQDHRRTSTTR